MLELNIIIKKRNMSYLINKIIKEEIEGFLEEDYPQLFDMETIKSFHSV